jgi:hypothetical protein
VIRVMAVHPMRLVNPRPGQVTNFNNVVNAIKEAEDTEAQA